MRIKLILLIFLSLQIVKTEDEKEQITFEGTEIESEYFTNSAIKYFQVNIKEGFSPKYIKILIQDEDIKSVINHIISFYQQDSKYENRKQLVQNFNYETELFLNSEQIKNEFFFTVECDKYPCTYRYIISEKENIEINLEDRYSYTYYVTEETKEMNFKIKGNPQITSDFRMVGKNVVTIWAKGNKNIKSELNVENAEKHSEFNAYLITLEKIEEFEYNYKVTGEIGDLINIGVSFFDGTYHNFYYNTVSGNIKEFSGFLKKGIKDVNCFKIEKPNKTSLEEDGFISFTNYNNYDIDLMSIVSLFGDDNYYKRCLSILDSNEGFYSFQFLSKNNEKNANIYPPQIIGKEYSRLIGEGDIIQLIPIKPDFDFQYITYKINIGKGRKINAFINSCETYPLCDGSLDTLEKYTKIQSYNSFSISFTKTEIDDFSSSPIDKKQKVLLIHCEIGARSWHTAKTENKFCLIKVNMYTDKNQFYLEPYVSHYRYIQKNNEDNFIIGLKNNIADHMVLNLELFSGKYSVFLSGSNNYEKYNFDKKDLYIFNDKERPIKIKALENSFYHLNYILKNKYAVDYSFTIGANYLFNLGQKQNQNILFADPSGMVDIDDKNFDMIIDFYPHNCNITIKKTFTDNDKDQVEELVKKDNFYQDITNKNQNIRKIIPIIFNYTIINEKKKDKCLVDVSFFQYYNKHSNLFDGIIFNNNSTKKLLFPSNEVEINCSYAYVEKNKDLFIHFLLNKEEKYLINIFLNDENYELSKLENEVRPSIKIESENLTKKCNSENQLCKLSFKIKSQNENQTTLKLKVSNNQQNDIEENDGKDDDNNDEDNGDGDSTSKLTIVLCVISIIIGAALIILIILYIIRRKNKKLSENISSVSFGETLNEKNDNEALLNNL